MTVRLPAVCPFCPLHCDDLSLADDGRPRDADCRIADHRYAALADEKHDQPHQVDTSDWRKLVDDLPLGESPRVEAIGVDFTTARVLVRLMTEGRIRLSTPRTPTQNAIASAVIRDGVLRATLGDVKAIADTVWMIGSVESESPRLIQRLLRSESPPRVVLQAGPIGADEMADIAAALRQIGERVEPISDENGGGDFGNAESGSLCETLGDSGYLAILPASDAFDASDADLAAVMMTRMIRHRNQKHRAVLVTLDSAATLDSLSLWATNRTVAASDARPVDVRVVGSLAATVPSSPATLQLCDASVDEGTFRYKIVTATAGVDFDSAVVRGDSSVTMPLPRQRGQGDRPTPAEVLNQLFHRHKALP